MQSVFSFIRSVGIPLILLGLCTGSFSQAAETAGSRPNVRPNVIVIMSDDMGYSDIGCYGGEINTPNLDKLAAGGLQFTQFYNTARCCPTRAALMTGLYSHQAGVGHMMGDDGLPGYRGDLNRKCVTIAEAMKLGGYRTMMSGKWHVTKETAPDGPKHNWPLQRGYDRFYGTIHGAGSFYDPNSLTRGNTQISPRADPEYKPETYYYTDAISDNAVKFIDEHQQQHQDKPFFMYVAYTAAHWPMHALEKDIVKYKGKYDKGYTAIREARYAKMKRLGLLKEHWKMSEQAEDWENVQNREWEIRCMEVYAAMVDNMDQGIGRIVSALKRHDQFDNTLVMFFQDNGGCAEGLGRRPRGKFTTHPEKAPFAPMKINELQTTMIPKQTRDGFPIIQGPGAMPGPDGTYIAYGRGWANVSNTPFREYKHWVHEGGISTPMIAHWPKGIKASSKLTSQQGHLIDIMATCIDVGDVEYPNTFKGNTITPLAGKSFVPVFETGKRAGHDAIFWEHEGNRAVRDGKWKLVSKYPGGWELYDIEADRTELHNLADSNTAKVEKLTAKYNAWVARSQVVPWKELQKLRRERNQKNKN
jgi:arylsulfatase A-like enzyme